MFCRHPPFSFPMSGINLAFLHTSGQLDVVPFRSHTIAYNIGPVSLGIKIIRQSYLASGL